MINRKPQLAPNWGLMIEDLMRTGMTQSDVGKAMGLDLTDRMLGFYRAGVQPTFWRGDALLNLWLAVCKKQRDAVPMLPVTRGHRVPNNREVSQAPRLAGNLPSFPPIDGASTRPAAKRGRRKVKEAA